MSHIHFSVPPYSPIAGVAVRTPYGHSNWPHYIVLYHPNCSARSETSVAVSSAHTPLVFLVDGVLRCRRCPLPFGIIPCPLPPLFRQSVHFRSEERRVGKECRSRWA